MLALCAQRFFASEEHKTDVPSKGLVPVTLAISPQRERERERE